MFSFHHRGSFKNLERFLNTMRRGQIFRELDAEASKGVVALAAATPKDSGATAAAWRYEIKNQGGRWTIEWSNDNVNQGVNIAIILQFGHGTGTGGYVAGRDYINPAIVPIFDDISERAWRAVTQA